MGRNTLLTTQGLGTEMGRNYPNRARCHNKGLIGGKMSNPESVRLRDGQTLPINQLSIEELHELGAGDAWFMGSPQTLNKHYLEGWEESAQQAKSEFDQNLDELNEQRNSWDIERA